MSYCRWSSNDHQCDVYVWADIDGTWRTEVAHRRRRWLIELPPKLPPLTTEGLEVAAAISRLLRSDQEGRAWEWHELPSPKRGHSYIDPTPGRAAQTLIELREQGFSVPPSVIDDLLEEQVERDES